MLSNNFFCLFYFSDHQAVNCNQSEEFDEMVIDEVAAAPTTLESSMKESLTLPAQTKVGFRKVAWSSAEIAKLLSVYGDAMTKRGGDFPEGGEIRKLLEDNKNIFAKNRNPQSVRIFMHQFHKSKHMQNLHLYKYADVNNM